MLKKDKEKSKLISFIPPLNYKGMKGKLWRVTSDLVRIRDFVIYQRCISCNKAILDWKLCDPGHFVAVGSSTGYLQFHLMNIHGQCRHCNMLSSFDMGEPYSKELDNRYGKGFAESIRQKKQQYAGYRDSDYIDMTLERIKLLEEIKREHGICPDYLI